MDQEEAGVHQVNLAEKEMMVLKVNQAHLVPQDYQVPLD